MKLKTVLTLLFQGYSFDETTGRFRIIDWHPYRIFKAIKFKHFPGKHQKEILKKLADAGIAGAKAGTIHKQRTDIHAVIKSRKSTKRNSD